MGDWFAHEFSELGVVKFAQVQEESSRLGVASGFHVIAQTIDLSKSQAHTAQIRLDGHLLQV